MQANWSLILNVLLFVGVVLAIVRLMKARRLSLAPVNQPSLGPVETKPFDDIIAVRKVISDNLPEESVVKVNIENKLNFKKNSSLKNKEAKDQNPQAGSIIMFLMAKENRQFAGYELLQTVLSVGLRFGDGHLFHRHQYPNGQGPVLCSLAAATSTGIFDLQNIGAFSVRGLCLFMEISGNLTIDEERFSIMYETAKQLRDGLDAYLLDEKQKPFTEESLACYQNQLKMETTHELSTLV